ncbi:MAG: hypothetical protein V4820_11935 [Pseudomonadota bacterium]
MTDLKPEDLARLQRIAERAAGMHGADQEHIIDVANEFSDAFGVETVLSLLADRARMEKALREAERELAFAVEHMGRTGGGYERALVSVRQALGASQ